MDMEKYSNTDSKRMDGRQNGAKSRSKWNKIAAERKISLNWSEKWRQRDKGHIRRWTRRCWQPQDFGCLGWRGRIDRTSTDRGQRETDGERGTREIYRGGADRSEDRRGESTSSTLSDRLTGSGLKWREVGRRSVPSWASVLFHGSGIYSGFFTGMSTEGEDVIMMIWSTTSVGCQLKGKEVQAR